MVNYTATENKIANVTIACEYSAPLLAPSRKGRFAGEILGAREARKEREGEGPRPCARNPLPLPLPRKLGLIISN